jgi:hypothetical protein
VSTRYQRLSRRSIALFLTWQIELGFEGRFGFG